MDITPRKDPVLVVDDNDDLAKCLADMVEVFGLECVRVSDGHQAIEELAKSEFSLVITDTQIPRMSGFTLLKHIRKNYPGTPVAVMSTRNSDMTKGIVVKDRVDYYLPKPFKLADIEKLLKSIS